MLLKNNIKETRSISFNKHIQFKNKNIPLGKIIIDDEHSKILIYETFEQENFVCEPDIYVINFKDLQRCKLCYKYESISEEELFYIMFISNIDWKNFCIEINSRVNFLSMDLYLGISGNFETLIDIYKTLNKITEQQ